MIWETAGLGAQQRLVDTERAGLKAHADTYLRLGGNNDSIGSERLLKDFRADARCDRTGAGPQAARVRAWCDAYTKEINASLEAGQYQAAVTATLSGGAVDKAFQAVDADRTAAIKRENEEIASMTTTCSRAGGGVQHRLPRLGPGGAGSRRLSVQEPRRPVRQAGVRGGGHHVRIPGVTARAAGAGGSLDGWRR
ncbi:hypothetical protein [Actinomadura physcomitrii]|uniref:hypothetical protein n=1 Tax=Actinomadura physcomitrii TaxID=2650748 RepID=UPI001F36ECE2|nr:hypothetical protein [Actinomadura physcomitrii]